MMTSSSQVVKVRSEKIAACMTCPICNKFFRDATSITECLHTFCRKCIYNKITEDELNSCPVCDIDLGCAPLEKLRADHILQDIRAKIFSSTKREAKEPEAVPSVTLPARRKERSLSSLVNTPNISSQTVMTRRRKPVARRASASRESTFSIEEPGKKVEDQPESSSSPVNLSKMLRNQKQNSYAAETSDQHMPNKGSEHRTEPLDGMNDLWKPLTRLVEAAGITKLNKSNSQGSVAQSAPSPISDDEAHVPKAKVKERGNKKFHDDENWLAPVPSGSVKPRKMRGGRRKKAVASEGLNISGQAVVDAASSKCERRVTPIWFTLVASEDQEGDAPLPQIPSRYLMIKDVNLPVSFIKKYLVQKLDLKSEAEVEITLQGQPILPNLRMHNLIDLWLQTAPTSERVKTSVGSSAKDFVMLICYGRKVAQTS
ncbi:E3 ubiquitin protein ligase DRIP2-like [Cornus florida]|uniref:E3 ubiquitin protein ligase DRIP2-like n=1 Tax=Cornus florida TaxID=4283 RepID=UPI002896B799|nr:E3 ubiquitin protein ligase DRIP2-like [Cornus florida]